MHIIKKYRGMLKTFPWKKKRYKQLQGRGNLVIFMLTAREKRVPYVPSDVQGFIKIETNLFFSEFVYSLNSVLSYFGTELFISRHIIFIVDSKISLIADFVKGTFTKEHFLTKWPYINIAKV